MHSPSKRPRSRFSWLTALAAALALAGSVAAQSASPMGAPASLAPRDMASAAAAAAALAALGGSAKLQSVVIQAAVVSDLGKTEDGTARLEATAAGDSRLELDLPDGPHVWVRSLAPQPAGQWSGPDGKAHALPLHNALAAPVWFFPALGAIDRLATDPTLGVAYGGAEARDGESMIHIRLSRQFANAADPVTAQALANLSAVDLYLDSATKLPRFLGFNAHPDDDAAVNLPIEIAFSDYRAEQGVEVPFHVQKFLRRTLVLDLTVQSVAINASVPSSDFTLAR